MIKLSLFKKILSASLFILITASACKKDMQDRSDDNIAEEMEIRTLSPEMQKVRDYVMDNAVIAHRGSTYWVPEETESSFRWARNIGADYLEIDVQMTKDGVLLALHDDNLRRTTNIGNVFPQKQDAFAYELTYEEMMQLDAGTWFNNANPNQARKSFEKEYISTLEDVIMIAQGYKLARNTDGTRKVDIIKDPTDPSKTKYKFYYEKDDKDNGNRPGVYIECKEPWMFPTMEKALYDELTKLGWNIINSGKTYDKEYFKQGQDGILRVNTGNTKGCIVLQTFSSYSLLKIENIFQGKVPTCFLLWLGDGFMKKSDSPYYYSESVNFAVDHKAHFTGPSISGAPNNYADLLKLWQAKMTHRSGLKIHAYSFDTEEQMKKYYGLRFGGTTDKDGKFIPTNKPLTDGMFTNRSEITINFYKEQGVRPKGVMGNDLHPEKVLDDLGYTK